MQQREESAAKTKFGQDEHMAPLVIRARTHEIDQVRMADFDEGRNFSLKLFSQVGLACVLSIVDKLELLHSDIILLISGLENVSTCSSTDLFLKSDVKNVDPKVVLAFLELATEDITRLLSLCLLTWVHTGGASPWAILGWYSTLLRLTLRAHMLGVHSL